MIWIISSLFAVSLTGLAYVLLRALRSGARSYSNTYSADTARQFEDLFLFIPPRRIAEIGWASSVAAFVLTFLAFGDFTSAGGILLGATLGTLAGGAALHAPRLLVAVLKRRRLYRFNSQLVDTLMRMSNALKAGFSITQAFESVVREGENPIAQEFDVCLQQTRVGISFSEALENLERRVGSDDLTLMISAIETSRRTGGNLTEILERISATIRERMRIENRIRTLTAQGRLQGIIVAAMPVVIALALMIVDPDMMMPFMRSRVGLFVFAAVAVLITCGALAIRKIIKIDV